MNYGLKISYLLLFVLLLISLLISCKTKKSFVADDYLEDKVFPFLKFDKLEDVISYASDNNKCLYMDFYADWCLPCQMMDESLYQDQYLASQFGDFCAVKVNGDIFPELVEEYQIRVYPTVLHINRKGQEVGRNEGVINSKKLLEISTQCE